MRRFYLPPEEAASGSPRITGPEAVHLRHVLRLGPGDPVRIFDGRGMEYDGVIRSLDGEGVSLSLSSPVVAETESPARITLAQAFLKEKKMEAAIRPLTELGIAEWRPFFSVRCVSRPGEVRLAGRRDRWEKIALESLKQCRRSQPPRICPPVSFTDMLAEGRKADLRLLFWEKAVLPLSGAGRRMAREFPPRSGGLRIFAVCGPEGGFSDAEAAQAREAGFHPVSLGPRILRAETAVLAAAALLQFLYGDL